MWSSKYTGNRGVVADYFQRVAIRIEWREMETDFEVLKKFVVQHMLRHIVLEVNLATTIDLSLLKSLIEDLSSQTVPETRLHWTIEFHNFDIKNSTVEMVVEIVRPNVIMISKVGSRNSTVTAVQNLLSLFDRVNSPVSLGISGMDLPDVQFCLDSMTQIALVDLGPCHPPNIHTHFVEFCHSRGRNSMIQLEDFDPHTSAVRRLSDFYRRSPAIVLAKAILQIGSILCLPSSIFKNEELCLTLLALNHPFTYLQTVYDPSHLSRFVLLNEEVEEISAESIASETALEVSQLSRYTSRPRGRELRNFSTIGLSAAYTEKLGKMVSNLEPPPEEAE